LVSEPKPVRRRVRITGRVQGVGFRYFVQRQAGAMGVRGWVRNLPDGSVSCEAQASRAVMERFLELLSAGPRFSRVSAVEVEEVPTADEPGTGFQIR
jgi:acylphosphatase